MNRIILMAWLFFSQYDANAAQPTSTGKEFPDSSTGCDSEESCRSLAFCSEADTSCALNCPDRDHDGHRALSCGGDDCEDADPDRFPGNKEIWDPANHDEDCNAQTSFSLLLKNLAEK